MQINDSLYYNNFLILRRIYRKLIKQTLNSKSQKALNNFMTQQYNNIFVSSLVSSKESYHSSSIVEQLNKGTLMVKFTNDLIMKVSPQTNEEQNQRARHFLASQIKCFESSTNSKDKNVNSRSEEEDSDIAIEVISQHIQEYKHNKAKEIANLHQTTQQPIDSIIRRMTKQIHSQVRSIINLETIAGSKERTCKSSKDDRSTMPNTSKHKIETPKFDLSSQKNNKKQLTVDPREFTLGQKEPASSNRSLRGPHDNSSLVSQFSTAVRYPTSRRIKDRIMNSGKCRDR